MLCRIASWLSMCFVGGVVLAVAATAIAQLPMTKLTALSPSGGKIGSEFQLRIIGSDLDGANRLIFSHPGITAIPLIDPSGDFARTERARPNTFVVRIAGDVPQGFHEVRAVGHFGVSNPRLFHVTSFDEVAKANGNHSREAAQPLSVGTIVSGQVENDSIDYYKITLAADQRLVIDCYAKSIDSRMDAALVLFDAAGRELRRVVAGEGQDPALELNASSDIEYVLGVHDFTYIGGPERFYRLAIHAAPHLDFVFPPVGQPGTTGKFTLYGRNLPGGKPVAKSQQSGNQLEQLDVEITLPAAAAARQQFASAMLVRPIAAMFDTFSWQLSAPQTASNPVAIGYVTAPLVIEAEPNDDPAKPQLVSVPCEFAGQFYPQRDSDWVQFSAQQGDVFWIDVASHRLGLPTDPVVVVQQVSRNDRGETVVSQIATMDDVQQQVDNNQPQMFGTASRDPQLRFEAKAAGEYRIGVRDLFGDSRRDPSMVYRLAIRQAQPDFQVLVFSGRVPSENSNQVELGGLALRRGQAAKLTVTVERRDGFDGEVQISAEGLPPGVTCGEVLLGGRATHASLILQAAIDAPPSVASFRLVAKAKVEGQDTSRQVRYGALTWGSSSIQQEPPVARMSHDMMLSVTDKETAPATATAGEATPIETSLGAIVKVPIQVARHNGFGAGLKFRAEGMPQNVQAKEVEIGGADGVMEISLNRNDIVPGIYTFHVAGQTKFKYTRNPDAVKALEDHFQELDSIFKEFTDKAKQAADAAKIAREQASQKPDDQSLADSAKTAGEAATQLEDKRKQAENLRRQAEQDLNNLRNNSKEKEVDYFVFSSPVTLRIAPTPIAISTTPPGNKRQGEKVLLPLTIQRKYGFEEAVEIMLESPGGVGGVSAPKINIDKGQTEGTLEITLNDNATVGAHSFVLRGRARYNNLQLDQTLPLPLTIDSK